MPFCFFEESLRVERRRLGSKGTASQLIGMFFTLWNIRKQGRLLFPFAIQLHFLILRWLGFFCLLLALYLYPTTKRSHQVGKVIFCKINYSWKIIIRTIFVSSAYNWASKEGRILWRQQKECSSNCASSSCLNMWLLCFERFYKLDFEW